MGHLTRHAPTLLACRFCPMCRHVCTVANAVQMESTSPRGWGLACFALEMGILSPEAASHAERLFQCATCDLCYEHCISQYQPSKAIKAARADLVEQGLVPPAVQRVAASVNRESNPFQEPRQDRMKGIERLNSTPDAEILFFVGCEISYRRPEIAKAFMAVCDAARLPLAVLAHENCCGAPLHTLGYRSEARSQAEQNVEAIASGQFRSVVFACPTCQRQMTQVYREEYGLNIPAGVEIMHTSQLVSRLLDAGRLNPRSLGLACTYHDPCTLGRSGLQTYKEPRDVLDAVGMDLVEAEWNHEQARCCGSATLHQTYPQIAQQACQNTVGELARTGVSLLATACPGCKSAFLPEAETVGIQVLDIMELVAQTL